MLLVCAEAIANGKTIATTKARIICLKLFCIILQNCVESKKHGLTVCKYRVFYSLYKIFCVTSGENYAIFAIFS